MRAVLPLAIGALAAGPVLLSAAQQQQPKPVFRGSVDRVAVATVVRTRQGKPVTNLTKGDFELFDSGKPRAIMEFQSEPTPVSLALLVDFSGSMDVADKRDVVRACAWHLVSWLTPNVDQIGLYAFDRHLMRVAPLGPAPGDILTKLKTLRPYGATSLFDAIAETGRELASMGGARRAVVAITDGADNSSRLTAGDVSGIASSIDVPVYIIVVVSPFDRSGTSTVDDQKLDAVLRGPLASLAHWTGGEIYAALGPARDSLAAQQIVSELRHEYLIVFQPDSRPGWHPIDIRTRQKDLVVRARSGYIVRGRPDRP